MPFDKGFVFCIRRLFFITSWQRILKKMLTNFFDNIDGAKIVNITKIARKAIENIALDSYETIIYLDLENF